MCICHRNWQANDCSERVCAFGRAHVDTPKGDLNADGSIENSDVIVVDNSFVYPYGTTEQFPSMRRSDLVVDTSKSTSMFYMHSISHICIDTAHGYMECSNKGECDRTTGLCSCYDGYDGVACQRASCPGFPTTCSGHGVCSSISQLAAADNHNVYLLWDKNVTMGCSCDAGFYGPDCSLRSCKYGLDPLYLDDATTIKYATFDFAVVATTTAAITTSTVPGVSLASGANADFFDYWSQSNPGKFAIRFYDNIGKAWLTDPIIAGSNCSAVIAALEALPNKVVPPSTVLCTQSIANNKDQVRGWTTINLYDAQHNGTSAHPYFISYQMAFWEAFGNNGTAYGVDNSAGANVAVPADASSVAAAYGDVTSNSTGQLSSIKLSGSIYRLKFTGNPGVFKQPEIETYLDGNTRPSLKSKSGVAITKVWTDGQQGEYNDYHADHCDGVTATLGYYLSGSNSTVLKSAFSYLTGLTLAEANLLKACLGDADGNMANNVEVYNWDYGSAAYPHLIKLVRSVTTYLDGGYYAAIWWDNSAAAQSLCPVTLGCFKLLNPFIPPDKNTNDNFEVYTTTGVFAKTTSTHKALFNFGSPYIVTLNMNADTLGLPATAKLSSDTGDVSCVTGVGAVCVNKGDLITVLSSSFTGYNPPHINMYTANKLATNMPIHDLAALYPNYLAIPNLNSNSSAFPAKAMTNVITTDLSVNWGNSFDSETTFSVYKFTPGASSTYNYVAECSNRGICNRATGVCTCFSGYTSDACSVQNSLAL